MEKGEENKKITPRTDPEPTKLEKGSLSVGPNPNLENPWSHLIPMWRK